jgi:YbbR domain-containing protein
LPKQYRRKTLIGLVVVLGLTAIGVFYFARGTEVTVPLTVQFTPVPDGYLVFQDLPQIEVRMKGPAGLVGDVSKRSLIHKIDLSSTQPGRHFVELSPASIEVPQGAVVLEVHPASFAIFIDKRGDKRVPVVPDLINAPAAGYETSAVVPSPSTVRLLGPATLLENISAIRTTPVDLSGMTERTGKKVGLNVPDGLRVEPETDRLVEIGIDVREKIVELSISVPVEVTGSDHRFTVKPGRISLWVRGPENTVNRLSSGAGILVRVDLEGVPPGTYVRPAIIEPPLDTTILKAEPMVFSVQVFD